MMLNKRTFLYIKFNIKNKSNKKQIKILYVLKIQQCLISNTILVSATCVET